MMADLKQFEDQKFMTLETFRKSSLGVKTPVWFARDGDMLYVWTEAQSGKAKRIRINPDVKLVPSKVDGTPIGEWVPAKAVADNSDEALKHINQLFKKKYGPSFAMFGLMGKMRGAKYTSIRLQLEA